MSELTADRVMEIAQHRVLYRVADFTFVDGAQGREYLCSYAWMLAMIGGEIVEVRHFMPKAPVTEETGISIIHYDYTEKNTIARINAILRYWKKQGSIFTPWLEGSEAIHSLNLTGDSRRNASAIEMHGRVCFLSGLLFGHTPELLFDEGSSNPVIQNPVTHLRKRLNGLAEKILTDINTQTWESARFLAGNPR